MRPLWFALFVCCMALPIAAPHASVAAVPGPDEVIRDTTKHLFRELRLQREAIKSDPQRAYEVADQILVPHADFRRMSRWVLGRYWKTASKEQRKRFGEEFRTMLVRTYASAMSEFLDVILEHEDSIIVPTQSVEPDAKRAVVRSEIRRNDGGRPVKVNYRMHRGRHGWKVYDVAIEGVSLVTNYRSTFAREIQRKGMDGLIADLSRRNEEAAAGKGPLASPVAKELQRLGIAPSKALSSPAPSVH